MKHRIFSLILTVGALLSLCAGPPVFAQSANTTPAQVESFTAGKFIANHYGGYSASVVTGNAATGSASIVIRGGYVVLTDGRSIVPFAVGVPLVVSDAAPELIVPTAVAGCVNARGGAQEAATATCTITAVFAAVHGAGATVLSATNGLAEAQLDALQWGGGVVVIAPGWRLGLNTSCTGCYASQNAAMAALLPYHQVGFEDIQTATPVYWNVASSTASFLATPTTLTAVTALPSATPVGAYGTGTYFLCVSYVDAMGNEGPCSATFSEAGLATGSFIFTAPAASTGAVGYTIYISLTSGSYAFAYKVPLTSTVCSLTTIETVTAACKVTNALYGQTGATATVTAITVNTAMLAPQLGVVSATTDYVPNSNARSAYAYIPGARLGNGGVQGSALPFTITTAAATVVPNVLGTITLPAGFMNYVGKTLRVCGLATATGTSTATIVGISLWWDAAGSNAAGVPAVIGGPRVTGTLSAAADHYTFCQDLTTTVASASVTGGSLLPGYGFLTMSSTVDGTQPATGPNATVGAVGSLNLAGESRIHVVYLHTTGTDGTGIILQNLTAQVLN